MLRAMSEPGATVADFNRLYYDSRVWSGATLWLGATTQKLPHRPVDEHRAVVRVDAGAYEGTMDALTHLYRNLSPCGYLVVGGPLPDAEWRSAVEDFRKTRGISDRLHEIDWASAFWRREA